MERDENADDYGHWSEDKSIFYCFIDECLIDTVFIIEEVDLFEIGICLWKRFWLLYSRLL